MNLLQNHMNRLFDTALHGWNNGDVNATTQWAPSTDIYETDKELVVNLDLPGVNPKMIDIRVENNVLTVRGERQFDESQNRENFHRAERMYGAFARSFTLPTSVDADKIHASYNAGVLRISLPKAEAAKPRKIEIVANAA